MELLDGETLRDRLGPGPLTLDTLLDLGHADRRRPRDRPRARHRASGHQAGQHLRDEARSGQASRLRAREARRSRPAAPGDTELADRDRGETPDEPRHGDRHGRLHVARAGARRTARRPDRRLLLRSRALRDGDGPAALRREHLGGHLRRDPEPRSGLPRQAQPGAARGALAHRQHRPRKGPGPALPERGGAEDGPEALEARLGLGPQRQDCGRARSSRRPRDRAERWCRSQRPS